MLHYAWPTLQILIGLTTANLMARTEGQPQGRSHRPADPAPERHVRPFTSKHKASNCVVADRCTMQISHLWPARSQPLGTSAHVENCSPPRSRA